MHDVMFFSQKSTDAWWQYLAENLNFTKSACVVSDMRGEGTINLVDDFYANLSHTNCAVYALEQLSTEVCDDIIRRCRVLRNLKLQQALAMIGAMWLSLAKIIHENKPRLIMTFVIDRYVMDILDRLAQASGIRFLSMTASIIPDHVMFMDRGKLLTVRKPLESDLCLARKQLLEEKFVPAYVKNNTKFSRKQYWKTFIAFKLRGVAFQFIRYWKRDKYNLHYLDALNHLDHKPRLGDHAVLGYFNEDWQKKLLATPENKRVFIGLQLLPEASLDYWLEDLNLLDNEEVVLKICKTLGKAGFTLFIKDHPLQFGFRKRKVMKALKSLPFVVLVPYAVPASDLIKACPVSVTFTGTIGFESALAGACSIVSGAYYADDKHFIHFHSLEDIESLPEKIALFQKAHPEKHIPDKAINQLLENVLAASAPGDLFSFRKFDKNNPEHCEHVAPLLQSLNTILPQFC